MIKDIYNKLKDKYSIVLTNTYSLNEGFIIDVPVLCGESKIGKFWLYTDDEQEFVFSIKYKNANSTHMHPVNIESAIEYIENFMKGLDFTK